MTFDRTFEALTGHAPFPWQKRLYEEFVRGTIPASCNLPTGLGKTSVVAMWLIALAHSQGKLPRRLVYVVNRRTVVDQTTAEAEKLRESLRKPELAELREQLQTLCAASYDIPLAISTLRGQFADNREWSADPARPAIIVGTVDMIGSRLLFSGYGIGFRSRPLHAGFLGQDALLVHDEAHLEPAFQKLIVTIKQEQTRCRDFCPPQVMELTATSRTSNNVFGLNQDDHEDGTVKKRIKAKKALRLHVQTDAKKLADQIADLAMRHKDGDEAMLIFVRTVEDVIKVRDKLCKAKLQVEVLTGTLRGKERDELIQKPVFRRFLPHSDSSSDIERAEGTVYLVCTSAGEVGVNISADHMVCDLSTFESMAQRFGRVNRFGDRNDTFVDVVYPEAFDEKDKLTPARKATLRLLEQLGGDAGPGALAGLDVQQCKAAFAPEPTILPATDILFDAWVLTTIRDKMPGRPSVDPYLHGIAQWQPPETHVAWREEVEIISGDLLGQYEPADLLDDYPLKPHELLRDVTDRKNTGVFAQLSKMSKRAPGATIWIIHARGEIQPATLQEVVDGDSRRLYGATVILPPSVGGLTPAGTLDGDAPFEEELRYDVADIPASPAGSRVRVWLDDPQYERKTVDMRRVRTIEIDTSEDEDAELRCWEWYESIPQEGGRTAKKAVRLDTHASDVADRARRIVVGLSLPEDIANAVVIAASLHDCGKRRERFQVTLGNSNLGLPLAKSGRNGARLPESFRHEFASVLDAQADVEFNKLDDEMKELVLHLIAAHHGRARPHFDLDEAFDPERPGDAEALAIETPRRFARLQRKYGRWGLAYLESLLRAADWAASAEPSAYADEVEGQP